MLGNYGDGSKHRPRPVKSIVDRHRPRPGGRVEEREAGVEAVEHVHNDTRPTQEKGYGVRPGFVCEITATSGVSVYKGEGVGAKGDVEVGPRTAARASEATIVKVEDLLGTSEPLEVQYR